MTTVSKNAAPVKTHRSKAKAEATRVACCMRCLIG